MTVQIRRRSARESDERLREIAIAAKAHWGYPRERVIEWASNGDFSAETLGQLEIWVAEAGRDIAGWASLAPGDEVAWLEDLWVDPRWMRQGVGSALFRRGRQRVAAPRRREDGMGGGAQRHRVLPADGRTRPPGQPDDGMGSRPGDVGRSFGLRRAHGAKWHMATAESGAHRPRRLPAWDRH
jgi:GNAT superfamily N-acetyltransferase